MSEDAQAPEVKKKSPWLWLLVGCGGLTLAAVVVVVAVVVFGLFKARDFVEDMEGNPARAAAEVVIRSNPDLEVVDSDDAEGTFSVRNLRTGEVATLDFRDIADGKLTFTTDEGEVTMEATPSEEGGGLTVTGPEGEARFGVGASVEDLPEWVPLFPNATETSGTFQTASGEEMSGAVTQLTEDTVQEVMDWFKTWLDEAGFDLTGETLTRAPQGSFGAVGGEAAERGRKVSVTVAETEEGTAVTITYEQGTR